MELAQELLEDSMARARDLATQKLVELGVSPEYAETIAEHAQSLLVEGVEALTTDGEGGVAGTSTDEVVLKLKEEIKSISAASALAFMGFFLRHRFLPFFDMVSDVFVIAEMCTNDPTLMSGVGGLLRGECTFDGENGDARRVCFVLSCVFLVLIWVVLWLALGLHLLETPAFHVKSKDFLRKTGFRPLMAIRPALWVVGFRVERIAQVFAGMPCFVFICVDLPE